MTWTISYRNPVACDTDNRFIDVVIDHPQFGLIPFTAAADDPEPSGAALYAQIVANQAVIPIAPYVAPSPPLSASAAPRVIG